MACGEDALRRHEHAFRRNLVLERGIGSRPARRGGRGIGADATAPRGADA